MTSYLDCAALSAAVYQNARGRDNVNPLPLNWNQIAYVPSGGLNGFTAGAYRNGNDIVIAFKGTDTALNSLANALGSVDDITSDVGLAAGLGSTQLFQAALFYEQIKADPRYQGCDITFTGHSLGGGLASIMSVWFNRRATTFDEAPFEISARNPLLMASVSAYLGLNGYSDSDILSFILNPFVSYVGRESQVANYFVKGEFLEIGRAAWPTVLGTDNPITIGGGASLSGLTLHSINLAAALLIQGKLRTDTVALPNLLPAMFDETLYAKPLTGDERDFLTSILNDQIKLGYTAPNGLLTKFAGDIEKLAQDGAVKNDPLNKALIAAAIEDYYFMQGGFTKDFFRNVTGGISIDLKDIGADWNSKDMKALDRLIAATQQLVGNSPVSGYLSATQPNKWYVQAGTDAMNVTDTGNDNVAMIGGAGSDGLVGGTGADLLIGNGGADLLQGKGGNDLLLGGKGKDTYVYTSGDGLDTILDTGDQNTLAVDGDILSGGADYGDARVRRSADGKHLYVETDGRMLIDGNLVIQNYASGGSFGLAMTGAAAVSNPQIARTIVGDLAPVDSDPAHQQVDGKVRDETDDLGNLKVTATASPNRADTLYDSAGNDRIESGGGDDQIIAQHGGDNLIDAGSGRDKVYAGVGNDVLMGGADGDILSGGAGDDRLYADSQISVATAIADGNRVDSGSSLKGDWLAGGIGADILVGSTGNDVLAGGGGTDLLIGGAGDDDLLGDSDWVASSFEWTVTDQATGRTFAPVIGTQYPTNGAVDVIYAGAGSDHAWGGIGNDVIFGEGGDDILSGEEGNDIILGGAGRDIIRGDGGANPDTTIGHDYLDGGDDADTIYGEAGDDIIIGGKGNDIMRGGAGRDTYLYNKGDGVDEVYDDDTGPEKSILVFGEGVDKDAIKLRKGSLLLDMGNGDAIHIETFDAANPLAAQSFASFQFADGSSLSWEGLLARGFDIDGTNGNDTLTGTGIADRIDGKAGNDVLYGLDGNDILTGGTGTDAMSGGAGDDTYVLNLGDSPLNAAGQAEGIVDRAGINTVQFGAGITVDAINTELDASGRYLFVKYGAADKLAVEDGATGTVADYRFAGGQHLSYAELIGRTASATLKGTSLTGTRFALGGKANDVIASTLGGVLISGGRGNDTLSGSGGGNTYLYSRGDGADILNESGQALYANGNQAPNRIRFGADIALSDLVFARRADGALHIGFADSMEGITLPGWYLGNNQALPRLQELVFADGSTFDTSTLNDLAVAPIEGTAGDDVLVGTWLDDTIIAGAGNDLIDGGYGDDTLIGGAGADSYVFNWESVKYWRENGIDTIIEASGEQSTLRLQRGMSLDLFRGERMNDDLRFRVRGAEHSVLIKDYYAGAQQWSITAADGSVTSMSDFLARPDPDSGDPLRQAWNDFTAAARWEWNLKHQSPGYGWELLADGRYHRVDASVATGVSVSAVTSSSTEWGWRDDGSAYSVATGPTIGGVYPVPYSGYSPNAYYSENLDGYGGARVTLDPYGGGYTRSISSKSATLQIQWSPPAYSFTSRTYRKPYVYAVSYLLDQNGNVVRDAYGNQIYDAWRKTTSNEDVYWASATGSVTSVSNGLAAGAVQPIDVRNALTAAATSAVQAGGAGGLLDLTLPSAMAGTHQVTATTEYVYQYLGGAGAEMLYTRPDLAQDGGGGNDIIISGMGEMGLAFGGEGNDKLFGGGSVDVLNGGEGDDYLAGMSSDDSYLVVRGQSGHDVIDEVVAHYSATDPKSGWNWYQTNADAGNQSRDTVRFGPGIALADLRFSYGVLNSRMVDAPATAAFHATLNISWAPGASIHVVLPNLFNPATAATLAANPGQSFGIEQFRFDDGTVLSMDAMRQRAADPAYQAPPEYGVPYLIGPGGVVGTTGDDWLYGSYGTANHIRGLGGNDLIYGNNLGDYLSGDAGDDYLEGGLGADILSGDSGNDTLIGMGGNVLIGGSGNDRLIASGGGNTFVYNLGDGTDVIVDTSKANGAAMPNIMAFGSGISSESITLDLGSLLIRVNGEEAIHIEGFDPQQPFAAPSIDRFLFTDGSSLAYSDLLQRGFDIFGTDNDDAITGTAIVDRITGGAGNDILAGGAGDDRYIYRLGDGSDRIADGQGNDTLFIEAGMSKAGFEADRVGNDLIIRIGGTEDLITLDNWYLQTEGVGRIEFDDDSFVARTEIYVESNLPPAANADSITVHEDGGALSFATADLLANDTDPNPDDVLAVIGVGTSQVGATVMLADGQVTYDIGSAFQELAEGEVVRDSFSYTIADRTGAQAFSLVNADIVGINDAPVTAADVNATVEDTSQAIDGNVLINDTDVDHGAVLGISVPGQYVGAYGTLALGADGSYAYALANDNLAVQALAQGEAAIDHFAYEVTDGIVAVGSSLDVSVTGTNDAPVTANDAGIVVEDRQMVATGNVLSNDTDVDHGTVLQVADAGTYAGEFGSLRLGADGRYTYTLDNAAMKVQSLGREAVMVEHFGYTATDGQVGTNAVLDVFLHGTNDAPIVVKPLADHDVTFNKPFSWQTPADSFKDIDAGDALAYSATQANGAALPDWLHFDAQTLAFSGMSPKAVMSLDVRVTVTDQVASTGSTVDSLAVSDVFRLSISHGNEGVGNGQDAAPAGQTTNFNDGAGTSPGNPGAKGGSAAAATATAAAPTLEVSLADAPGTGSAAFQLTPAVPTYLGLKEWQQYGPAATSSTATTDSASVFARWLAVDLAVAQALAGNGPAWLDDGLGADTSALNKATTGYLGSTHAFGKDAFSLLASSGQNLQNFKGLAEGVQKIA